MNLDFNAQSVFQYLQEIVKLFLTVTRKQYKIHWKEIRTRSIQLESNFLAELRGYNIEDYFLSFVLGLPPCGLQKAVIQHKTAQL